MTDILGSADPGYNDGYDPSTLTGSQGLSGFGPWAGQYGGQTNPLSQFDPTNLLSPGTLNTSSILPITGDLPSGLSGTAGQGPGIYGSTPSAGSAIQNMLSPNSMSYLSSVLGGFSSGQKANRVLQGQLSQNYDKNMMEAQQLRNQNESDALKKLAITNFILNGKQAQVAPSLALNGGQHSTYSGNLQGVTPVSAAQQQGAQALQNQLVPRLSPGGSYTPQPLSSYATPGTAENVGSYGALGAGLLGTLGLMSGPNNDSGSNPIMTGLSDAGNWLKGLFGG